MGKEFGVLLLALWAVPFAGSYLAVPWTPVLEIPQGRLRGLVDTTYSKYLGIPYARVLRRFTCTIPVALLTPIERDYNVMPPADPPIWKGTFDAIVDRKCKQLVPTLLFPYGTEDNCLVLNVYVPRDVSPERPAPVMVFIHGGGYFLGSGSSLTYGPELLMRKGVVLVTINYRLGAFGFLCLGLPGAPGNAGLKDQVAALRWINRNIHAFGGDPSSVTVFGESAGAASADLLVLSDMSNGLVHRAILQSTVSLSPFVFNHDPVEKASKVAAKLGYKTLDPEELLAIFRNTSANDIMWATESDDLLKKYNFRPCAEKVFAGVEPFITKSPFEMLSSGAYRKVPMIIGSNDREGLLFVGRAQKRFENYKSNFDTLLPDDLKFESDRAKKALSVEVMKFYFGNDTYSRERNLEAAIDFVTDAYFQYSIVRAAELHRNPDTPIYSYYFTYESARNLGKALSQLPEQRGATHFDEVLYLFEPSIRWAPLAGRDLVVAERMTQMWTDFAKTGNPTPSESQLLPNLWTASTSANLSFYELGDEMRMRDLPNPDRIKLWRDIYDTYGYRS